MIFGWVNISFQTLGMRYKKNINYCIQIITNILQINRVKTFDFKFFNCKKKRTDSL